MRSEVHTAMTEDYSAVWLMKTMVSKECAASISCPEACNIKARYYESHIL
jgi:hypothetical protein